jgi:hypothetical protein
MVVRGDRLLAGRRMQRELRLAAAVDDLDPERVFQLAARPVEIDRDAGCLAMREMHRLARDRAREEMLEQRPGLGRSSFRSRLPEREALDELVLPRAGELRVDHRRGEHSDTPSSVSSVGRRRASERMSAVIVDSNAAA